MEATLSLAVVFLDRSSFLTFLRYSCFVLVSFHVGGKKIGNGSKRCRVATQNSWQFSRKSCEDRARVRKRHFIKNKFREEADGYPRASRGFHAVDSLPRSLSLYLSTSRSLLLSPIHNSTRLSRLSRERYLDVLHFSLPLSLYCELVLTCALSPSSAQYSLSQEFSNFRIIGFIDSWILFLYITGKFWNCMEYME